MAIDNLTLALMGWEIPAYQALPLTVTSTDDAVVALAGYPGATLPETAPEAPTTTKVKRRVIVLGRSSARPRIRWRH